MVKRWQIAAAAAGTFTLVALSAEPVDEAEHAVITRFGRVVQVIAEPGLAWKLPLIDRAITLDRRLLITHVPESEFLTADKKNVMAGLYVNWRIADPVRFLAAVRTRQAAESRLTALVQSALGSALGETSFTDFVSPDAAPNPHAHAPGALEALEATIRDRTASVAAANFGIALVDLGLTRFNFPDQNLVSVFARMRAERERIAKAYRSEGDAEAQKIVAEANRTAAETVASADAEAQRLRGAGEAEAARIYADAYKGKEEFYGFLRTLEAYEQVINDKTTLVLPADAPLLKLLLKPPAGVGAGN